MYMLYVYTQHKPCMCVDTGMVCATFYGHIYSPIFVGTFLGYSKSPKYQEWTNDLSAEDLRKIEVGSKSAEEVAKALFMHPFKQNLEERPDGICATSNRLDGQQFCDPTKMSAIQCIYTSMFDMQAN